MVVFFSKLEFLVPNQKVLMKIEMKLLKTFPFSNDGSVSVVHYLLSQYHNAQKVVPQKVTEEYQPFAKVSQKMPKSLAFAKDNFCKRYNRSNCQTLFSLMWVEGGIMTRRKKPRDRRRSEMTCTIFPFSSVPQNSTHLQNHFRTF